MNARRLRLVTLVVANNCKPKPSVSHPCHFLLCRGTQATGVPPRATADRRWAHFSHYRLQRITKHWRNRIRWNILHHYRRQWDNPDRRPPVRNRKSVRACVSSCSQIFYQRNARYFVPLSHRLSNVTIRLLFIQHYFQAQKNVRAYFLVISRSRTPFAVPSSALSPCGVSGEIVHSGQYTTEFGMCVCMQMDSIRKHLAHNLDFVGERVFLRMLWRERSFRSTRNDDLAPVLIRDISKQVSSDRFCRDWEFWAFVTTVDGIEHSAHTHTHNITAILSIIKVIKK